MIVLFVVLLQIVCFIYSTCPVARYLVLVLNVRYLRLGVNLRHL